MPSVSVSRIEAVRRAAKRWQRDLVDTSGRNRLRRYRDLKTGTLDLTPQPTHGPDPLTLDRLLSGRAVRLSALFVDAPLFEDAPIDSEGGVDFGDARRRLVAIHKAALTNLEEKGIETLFTAIGLAKWEVDSGLPPNAPVLLLPLTVEATGAAARDFKIEIAGEAFLSPVLAHILRTEHDMETDPDEAVVAEKQPTNYEEFSFLLNRLEKSWKNLPDLTIDRRIVVSGFSYSTQPLVDDLENNADLFAENDIVAAFAGDEGARKSIASRICDPNPSQPDFDPPASEFLALDADSSQHVAINRALGGESLVIQGPPGTGKSQTIANLITALIAGGKRVLFVAEKRAAIEAVTKRLVHVGLDDLVMDMHGGVTSRREFARSLADSLEKVATIPEQDYSSLHRRLQTHRDPLIANDDALHSLRNPWSLSVFELRQRLLGIPEGARTPMRLPADSARSIDGDSFERLADDVREWIGLGGHSLAESHPDWAETTITTEESAQCAFELARDIKEEFLPRARDVLFGVLNEAKLSRPKTVGEWGRTARFLAVASGSWRLRMKAQVLSKEYRTTKEALGARSKLSLASGKADFAVTSVDAFEDKLAALSSVAGLDSLPHLTHERLAGAVDRIASDINVAARLPRIRKLEARFRSLGIENVIERVGKDIAPEYAAQAVEHAWIERVLEELEFEDSRLAAFSSDAYSRHRDEFADADGKHRDSTPQRVRRLTAEAIIETMNNHPDEARLVRHQAALKRRHLSARQLLERAPHVLSTLRPCWTMSPILAAELIPADLRLFDVVIFDEASQIPPAEAIGSLARAPQAVIAGDSRQLPPTSFFGRSQSDDDDDDHNDDVLAVTGDIESLLDAAGTLLRDNMLQWHYRSRDDRLIAFSNIHIYGGSLTAFPGATVNTPVTHYLIPFRPIVGVSGTRSNPDEVEKVVELILEHARVKPRETLGVIAFGQHHADNIENTLMRRLAEMNDPSLDEFFAEKNEERFFVKNIERVQGDERDAIILSVGYHKDANGNLPYRFGPMLQEGGERRLNVAVTRARSRLTVVSSFSHHDMSPGRSTAKGVDLLRRYIEFATSGGRDLGADVQNIPLNPFELAIKEGLERRGIPVTPQYGVSGYRVDFACAHPDEPGRMVLAIEADGAMYHSAPTARDRDRLRQQVLEDKGWRFHRIWSTAWFRNREAELDKALEAWKEAVAASDKGGPTPIPEPSSSNPVSSPTPRRGPRPGVPRRGMSGYNSIGDYGHGQLVSLARWIESDTLLRTDEDLMREMMRELGFKRSGSRITQALTAAIRDARPKNRSYRGRPRRRPL